MQRHQVKLQRRKKHIRKDVMGTADKPRLSVFRSNQHISAQLIDDVTGHTLVQVNDNVAKSGTPTEKATAVGAEVASLASKQKIESVVFDRNGRKFHGRIKALAEAARAGGLKF